MLGAVRPSDAAVKRTDMGALVERAYMKMPKGHFCKGTHTNRNPTITTPPT